MAHHRFQQRTTTVAQERQRRRAFANSPLMWDDVRRSRQLQGVKRRRFIRRINEFWRRLMDPNDPFGKYRGPIMHVQTVDASEIKD